jgi:DNA-directed RNA polymerase subunit M/transcription elongation factor TFIIS
MWTTYELESQIVNSGKLGETGITAQELYESDLRKYAEKRVIRIKVQDVFTESAKQHDEYGHLFDVLPVSGSEVDLVVYHTTSFFNSLEMSKWIDMRLDRLEAIGIPQEMNGMYIQTRDDLLEAKGIIKVDEGSNLKEIVTSSNSPEIPDSSDDDLSWIVCPKCGNKEQDFDGFGFLYCEKCGYCLHPNSTKQENGDWVCGVCGKIIDHEKSIDSVAVVEKMFGTPRPKPIKAWEEMMDEEKRESNIDRFFDESQIGLF